MRRLGTGRVAEPGVVPVCQPAGVTWRAPEVERSEESFVADERAMLVGILERHRETFVWKCAGLTGDQLALRSVPPSNLSLLGLVRHLADAERAWFGRYVGGQELPAAFTGPDRVDAAFDLTDAARAEDDYDRLVDEWELSRRAVVGVALDHQFVGPPWGVRSLRWVYQHLIEEYARHNGHADLLRQAIDGAVGQ